MNAHSRALALLQSERDIVDILYIYLDRMNDPSASDPLEKSAAEFVKAVAPAIDKHLSSILLIVK